MPLTLTKAEARRFMLLKQGLIGDYIFEGRAGALEFVSQAGCVQFDPINICGRSPELALLSRVKNVKKDDLFALLYEDRALIDYYDKELSIVNTRDWPCFSRTREIYRSRVRSKAEIEPVADMIKSFIRERGPVCSGDLDFNDRVDWYWSKTRLSRAALEAMYFCGDLVVHHKKGAKKYYDLAESHIPADLLSMSDPNSSEDSYFDWNLLRRIGAVGLLWNRASYALLGIQNFKAENRNNAFLRLAQQGEITEIAIEGIKHPFFCKTDDLPLLDRAAKNEVLKGRTEFIAPLDSFIWDRKLIRALFDFDYSWEIYTPAAKRVYGYYTVPILFGERFVGRIEPVVDRRENRLFVKGLWLEEGVKPTGRLSDGIRNALRRLAKFNGCGEAADIYL